MKHILTRVMVAEGVRVPRGYGFAYRDFDTATTVAYPIPLNLIVRGLRRLWHWVIGGFKHSVLDEAYMRGYAVGKSEEADFWQRVRLSKSAPEQPSS